jgi:hypothetical protein
MMPPACHPPVCPPQVRIPAHCLTSNNRHVRARQLWGSDVYTEDSDLVAVLMHCGYWYHSRERRQGSRTEHVLLGPSWWHLER